MTIQLKKYGNQTGFSLVELMVGLVIGLMATLVIMQTFSSFEGNKRSTTGISDAQTNGSIGLYMIQRELQFAGYGVPAISGTMPNIITRPDQLSFADYTGMTQAQIDAAYATAVTAYNAQIAADLGTVTAGENYSSFRCSNTSAAAAWWPSDIDNNAATPKVAVDVVTPVTITDGVNSDTITLQYGSTTRGAIPARVITTVGVNYVGLQNNLGCRSGDIVLALPDTNTGNTVCDVSEVTSTNAWLDTAGNTNSINVTSNAGMLDPVKPKKLACLGQIRRVVFDVNGNQLRKGSVQAGAGADMQPITAEIVALQAQYGISATANSEIVNPLVPQSGWVDATGATWGATPLAVSARNRIKAVRVALVARNNLLEKTAVSQACTGAAAGLAKVCIWGNQDVTLPDANWANYRYRVYEIVIPLRNILAASPQL